MSYEDSEYYAYEALEAVGKAIEELADPLGYDSFNDLWSNIDRDDVTREQWELFRGLSNAYSHLDNGTLNYFDDLDNDE
jgi:hypothetical protein